MWFIIHTLRRYHLFTSPSSVPRVNLAFPVRLALISVSMAVSEPIPVLVSIIAERDTSYASGVPSQTHAFHVMLSHSLFNSSARDRSRDASPCTGPLSLPLSTVNNPGAIHRSALVTCVAPVARRKTQDGVLPVFRARR